MIYFKRALYGLSLFFILMASILAFLFTTTPGLYTTLKLVNLFLPGKLSVENASGRLIKHASFKTFYYTENSLLIKLTDGNVHWKLTALLHHQLPVMLTGNYLLVAIKGPHHHVLAPPVDLQINGFKIKQVEIQYHGKAQHFKRLSLRAAFKNKQWVIHSLQTDRANQHFILKGNVTPFAPYPISARLDFSSLSKPLSELQGHINMEGDISLYHWQGQWAGSVHGNMQGSLKNGLELSANANWHHATWPINTTHTLKSSRGHVVILGTLPDVIIDANAHIESPITAQWQLTAQVKNKYTDINSVLHLPQGQMSGHATYDKQANPQFKGEIFSKQLHFSNAALPLHGVEFKANFSGNSLETTEGTLDLTAEYMDHLLRTNIHYDKKKIDANVMLGANVMRFTGHFPYSWQAKITIPQPQLIHPSLTGLQTTISANTTLHSAQEAELNLSITPGLYRPSQNEEIPALPFKGGRLSVNLTPTSLQTKGDFTIDQDKTVHLRLNIPKFRLNEPKASSQAIDGQLNLQVNSLSFLQRFSQTVDQIQGQLKMRLTAKGPLMKPQVKGELLLSNGSLSIPKSGLTFKPIQAKLQSSNNHWQAQGSITSLGKALNLTGQGDFSPQITGQLNLLGDNFPAIKNTDYTLLVSPQLTLRIKPDAFDITGSILVPSAQLKPLSFSNTVSLSEDVVFVRKESKTISSPFNITTDVQINMGKDVALDVKGLHGFLDGSIRIKQVPHSPMTAMGELSMRDGTYRAYGQDLIVDQGQLIFSGPLTDSPGIHLRAIRKFSKSDSTFINSNQLLDFSAANLDSIDVGSQTTVGVEMTGRLNAHKIKLFSIPSSLSQSDILSMLLLGKPASQASKAGGQLLLAAISSMNLDSGSKGLQLLEQLKQSLGVDLNLQNNIRYNQTANQNGDNTALVVGKSLSKRIYLSYNVGLMQQDTQVFTLKYLLNKFFSIQVSASDIGNGVDLLYTHSKD